jgi:hypothetical protein
MEKKLLQGWKDYLFIITILFFILGFFNIVFGLLGFACMTIPFILLIKDKKKTWCQGYCPRADLFSTLFRNRSLTGKAGPDWLVRGKAKWVIFVYFLVNLFVLTMSTAMVLKGRIEPIDNIRFLLAFNLPWNIPQLLDLGATPDWMIHLSFRMYSMMLTTTILGLLLAWIFKPRTWCTVCPVNTASDLMLKNGKK